MLAHLKICIITDSTLYASSLPSLKLLALLSPLLSALEIAKCNALLHYKYACCPDIYMLFPYLNLAQPNSFATIYAYIYCYMDGGLMAMVTWLYGFEASKQKSLFFGLKKTPFFDKKCLKCTEEELALTLHNLLFVLYSTIAL